MGGSPDGVLGGGSLGSVQGRGPTTGNGGAQSGGASGLTSGANSANRFPSNQASGAIGGGSVFGSRSGVSNGGVQSSSSSLRGGQAGGPGIRSGTAGFGGSANGNSGVANAVQFPIGGARSPNGGASGTGSLGGTSSGNDGSSGSELKSPASGGDQKTTDAATIASLALGGVATAAAISSLGASLASILQQRTKEKRRHRHKNHRTHSNRIVLHCTNGTCKRVRRSVPESKVPAEILEAIPTNFQRLY